MFLFRERTNSAQWYDIEVLKKWRWLVIKCANEGSNNTNNTLLKKKKKKLLFYWHSELWRFGLWHAIQNYFHDTAYYIAFLNHIITQKRLKIYNLHHYKQFKYVFIIYNYKQKLKLPLNFFKYYIIIITLDRIFHFLKV